MPFMAKARLRERPLMYKSSSPPHQAESSTILESSFVAHELKLAQTKSWLFDTMLTSP